MNYYAPDKWVVVKIEGKEVALTYKVFACFYGGYLNGDSWKMNSGITKVTKEEDCYLFEGYSGSVYKCHENTYGSNNYGASILLNIIKKSDEVGVYIDVLPEDTNWLDLSFE